MKLKYEFAFSKVFDAQMAVPVGPGSERCQAVLHLNETGQRILELLQTETTEDAIVATMMEEYEVEEPVLRSEVQKILTQLREADLLID